MLHQSIYDFYYCDIHCVSICFVVIKNDLSIYLHFLNTIWVHLQSCGVGQDVINHVEVEGGCWGDWVVLVGGEKGSLRFIFSILI